MARPAITHPSPALDATARRLREFYEAMYTALGPQQWWPAQSPTEVIIGAILTQNTNWIGAAKAIERLREAGLIDWARLRDIGEERLAELVRPAGTFRVKARRLKAFVAWLWASYGGSLDATRATPTETLRTQLLGITGIGPETADAILLYALARPSFVIDAYTGRLLRRHKLVPERTDYHGMKRLFEAALPAEVHLFNEYHALVVEVGKRHCRPRARCDGCPLEPFEHDKDRA